MENNLYDYELRSVYEKQDIKQGISDIVGFSTKVTNKKHVKNSTNFKNWLIVYTLARMFFQ